MKENDVYKWHYNRKDISYHCREGLAVVKKITELQERGDKNGHITSHIRNSTE